METDRGALGRVLAIVALGLGFVGRVAGKTRARRSLIPDEYGASSTAARPATLADITTAYELLLRRSSPTGGDPAGRHAPVRRNRHARRLSPAPGARWGTAAGPAASRRIGRLTGHTCSRNILTVRRRQRGRPLKFGRPAQLLALTLPHDVVAALRRIHPDPAWAIVKLHEKVAKTQRHAPSPSRAPIELAQISARGALIVVDPRTLRSAPGMSVVPVASGRAFLAFDEGRGLADLELAILEQLQDPEDRRRDAERAESAPAAGPRLASRAGVPLLQALDHPRRAGTRAPVEAHAPIPALLAELLPPAADRGPPLHHREGADRERPEPAHLHRHGEEAEARIGQAARDRTGARRSGCPRRSRVLCAERRRSEVSSMLRESIPTSAAP